MLTEAILGNASARILNASLFSSAAAKVATNLYLIRPCFSSFQKKMEVGNEYLLATANPYVLNPPIGEVDNPENQTKHLLTDLDP